MVKDYLKTEINLVRTCSSPLWYQLTELVLAAMLLLQCRTVWVHLSVVGGMVNKAVFAVTVLALAVCICFDSKGKLQLKFRSLQIKTLVILGLYIAIFVLVNPVNYRGVIRCGIILMMTVALVQSEDAAEKIRQIFISYKNIMVIIAAVSVICWTLLSLMKVYDYPWSGDIYVDWSDAGEIIRRSRFSYIYYETQWFIMNVVARNTSIFVEGPMASYCLAIAALIELYMENPAYKRERILCRISLLLAILTAFTTAGYLFLGTVGAAAAVKALHRRYAGSAEKSRFAMKAVTALFVLAACFWIYLFVHKTVTVSGSIRMDDISAGFAAWTDRFWFGGGFNNQIYLDKYITNWRIFNIGYSNSPLAVLAFGGLYLGLIYIYAWIRIVRNAFRHRSLDSAVVTLLYLMYFTVTIIPFQHLTIFMLTVLAADLIPYSSEDKERMNAELAG